MCNKVILMGRVCKEIELEDKKGYDYCAFTLAVDRRFKKEGEEKTADFIRIIAWKKTAVFMANYFSKGQKVVVVGSIRTSHWTGDNGKEVYLTEVVVDEAYFAESKRSQNESRTEPSMDIPVLDKIAEADDPDSDLPF